MFSLLAVFAHVQESSSNERELSRRDFPSEFLFGVASSAYQYEGGYLEDGNGLSNWDEFSHIQGTIADGKNGDVADDSYHLYNVDVELMSELGVDSYRFSISWARIFPDGRGEINLGGVKYYTDLIDSLLLRGIRPFVTLSHYDIPQALEDLYGGWLSLNIVDDFTWYAEACFRIFGGRVKYWSTFNEPNAFIPEGYDTGKYPPGRCSRDIGTCRAGNSSTEPYIAAHNVLLAHASVVQLYRTVYQPHQHGFIGMVVGCPWFEPLRNSSKDIAAVQRVLDFLEGWFLDPIVFGEYPDIMRKLVGTRLPRITPDLSKLLRGSYDFIGVNYYSALYVTDASYFLNYSHRSYSQDCLAITTGERNGVPIGPQMWPPTMYGVPYGLRKIVEYIKRRYLNPAIFITENGARVW
jgi:beta-glucosidase/6-phospho-beta-glucosidase/beta-galactosidase